MALRTHGEVSLLYFIVLRSNEAKQRKKLTLCHARAFAPQPLSESGHSSLHVATTYPQALPFYTQALSCPAMVRLHQTSPSPDILQVFAYPQNHKAMSSMAFMPRTLVRGKKKTRISMLALRGKSTMGIKPPS